MSQQELPDLFHLETVKMALQQSFSASVLQTSENIKKKLLELSLDTRTCKGKRKKAFFIFADFQTIKDN